MDPPFNCSVISPHIFHRYYVFYLLNLLKVTQYYAKNMTMPSTWQAYFICCFVGKRLLKQKHIWNVAFFSLLTRKFYICNDISCLWYTYYVYLTSLKIVVVLLRFLIKIGNSFLIKPNYVNSFQHSQINPKNLMQQWYYNLKKYT